MRIPKAIAVMVITGGILAMVGSVFAYKTVKWALGRMQLVQASENKLPAAGLMPQDSRLQSGSGEFRARSDAMSHAFHSGQLPKPMPAPAGDLDQVAAELAKRVLAADDQSTGALLTAIQMSGLSVRADDGSIAVRSTEPSQGLAFAAWEVAAMAKLFGQGGRIHLARFSQAILGESPKAKQVPLASLLIKDIAADAQGQSQPIRFWARFIVELGRQRSHRIDLLSADVDPNKVRLDPIQFSFIVLRLVGDALMQKPRHTSPSAVIRQNSNPPNAVLADAAWHSGDQPRLIYVSEGEASSGSDIPCSLTEEEGIILDLAALGIGTGYATLAEYLKSVGLSGLQELLESAGQINGVLMVLRVYLIESAMNVDLAMDEPKLVRTTSTTEGERRHLTAVITIDLGKWQSLNCLRTATNLGGLDLGNLPHDAAGVGVEWKLVEGGDPRGAAGVLDDLWNGELGQNPGQIVGLKAPDNDQDNSYIMDRTADENGVAKMDVIGTPQLQDLSNRKLVPVEKEMAIQIGVKFKNANTAGKLFGEGVDLLNSLLLAATGDPSAPVNLATETLYRCHCFQSPIFRYPVKDWAPNGLWVGTVTYVENYRDDKPAHTWEVAPKATMTSQISDDRDAAMTLTLTPDVDSLGIQIVKGTASRKDVLSQHSEGHSPVCNWAEVDVKTLDVNAQPIQGTISVDLGPLGTYSIRPMINTRDIKETVEETLNFLHSCSPKDKGFDISNSFTGTFDEIFWNTVGGSPDILPDKQHPDVLQGSSPVYTLGLGQTGTVTWDLRLQ